jgi:hypothetical protein
MTSRKASTIKAAITEIMKEMTVTTTTENAADFGFLAPSSLLTLTLLVMNKQIIIYI